MKKLLELLKDYQYAANKAGYCEAKGYMTRMYEWESEEAAILDKIKHCIEQRAQEE